MEAVYLPVSLNIAKLPIVMIGGGSVALHKLAALTRFTRNITIIAEDLHPELSQWDLPLVQKRYEASDLDPFKIVYACTNNRAVNRAIARDAQNLGLLVCVADDPELCDFISPAIYKNGHMSVAVSSSGREVKRAVAWRNRLREMMEGDSWWLDIKNEGEIKGELEE